MIYKKLGKYIQQVNVRNRDLEVDTLLGVSITKKLIPSIANTIGTDMSVYKIIEKRQFAYGTVTSRNGEKISIALADEHEKALVSQIYVVFEVINTNVLLPEYLMMWFSRPEFDRYARFHSHGSTRETFDWADLCETELPIPTIEKQRELVAQYQSISNKVKINEQICEKLEATAQTIFSYIVNSEDDLESYRLGDLIEIKGGFSYKSEDLGKGDSFLLGMGCVSFSERFIESGMRLYSDNVPRTHLVFTKDIIIATRQQSENFPILGFPAMIPPNLKDKRLIIASNLYRVINKSDLSIEFIYQILKSNKYQDRIKEQTKGTTVGMITKDAIEDYIFQAVSISSLIKLQPKINKVVDTIFVKTVENQKLKEFQSLILSRLATLGRVN